MQAALKRDSASVEEPNEAGHRPLHLASIWPDGLSLLLAHGADYDKTDALGQTPVELAIFHGCVESVQLLLKAGCSFVLCEDIHGIGNVFVCAAYLYLNPNWTRWITYLNPNRTRWIRTFKYDYFEILKIVIRDLALRQGEVISSMIDVPILTRSKVSMSDNGQHFRSGAAHSGTSYPSLREGTPRLQSILPGMRTPYHFPDLTVKVANELWDAGFRDIDVPDENHRTPLMTGRFSSDRDEIIDLIETAFWLYQKGAALHRHCCATLPPGPNNVGSTASRLGRRAIHFVAAAVKEWFVFRAYRFIRRYGKVGYPAAMEHEIDNLNLDCRQFLHKILLDGSPDGCFCACSGHGCTPMTFWLKRRWSWWLAEDDDDTVVTAWGRRWFFDNVPTEHLSTVSSQEILRLITFEELGLRHTCCEFYVSLFRTPKPEEVDEFRDEDHEGIQLLESLLSEFEEKRGDEDIKSFVNGYWSTRMEEVLAALDEVPIDRTAMREIGVIVEDDDGSSDADVETE